jgi:uncharacterized protein
VKPARIPALDALRGFALFGILIVNAPFFLWPEGSFGTYALQAFPGWHNRAAEFLTSWLFDGKFILIFSFLFGWSLHTQVSRRPDFTPRYFRRLLGLFLIGLAHAVFLFVGDILVTYALLGVPLYFMRNLTVRTLLKITIVLWITSIVTQAGLGYALVIFSTDPTADYRAIVALHQSGAFMDIVAHRVDDLIGLYLITPFLFGPEVMAMFLLGLAAAKTYGRDSTLASARPLALSLVKWLWLPGITFNALYALANATVIFNAAIALGMRGAFVPLLTLVYISAAVLILDRPWAAAAAKALGGEGRMSLSIYIGESVLMGWIALSYGLGLFGRISPALAFPLCMAVYAALMAAANLWLSVFRLGPLEWLLRSLTEGRAVALTRPAGS